MYISMCYIPHLGKIVEQKRLHQKREPLSQFI
uniref:(California timema) hypothetical protein n=1 Tax=Timema californicum TaxID=61474 RepID=A0A7R9P5F1_TIMCA|nr:unnamed protein product [Timema californicum]